MPDTKSPNRESPRLAALKTAILAEQRVLELDSPIARARIQVLLNGTLPEIVPTGGPILVLSRHQESLYRAPTCRSWVG